MAGSAELSGGKFPPVCAAELRVAIGSPRAVIGTAARNVRLFKSKLLSTLASDRQSRPLESRDRRNCLEPGFLNRNSPAAPTVACYYRLRFTFLLCWSNRARLQEGSLKRERRAFGLETNSFVSFARCWRLCPLLAESDRPSEY